MLKPVALASLALGVLLLAGCDVSPTGQDIENRAQAASQMTMEQAQPIPRFAYSQIRQNMIELETVEANGIQTTSFMFGPANSPDPVQSCPSIGVPIPNTMSLSNPQQVVPTGNYNAVTTGQMDPNGLYAPAASSGTFVMCVQADGKIMPVYVEGNVHTVFGPAVWDKGTHSVEMTGPASFHFSAAKGH
ncbi:MAG: hypothetical protein JWO67_4488 [Streptosporangiaceae bacterium]|nr:hypothetical protein [Streptosporangiaceae bacterium]